MKAQSSSLKLVNPAELGRMIGSSAEVVRKMLDDMKYKPVHVLGSHKRMMKLYDVEAIDIHALKTRAEYLKGVYGKTPDKIKAQPANNANEAPATNTNNERLDKVEEILQRHGAILEKLATALGIVA
jgi:pyruvate/oxaloacetate carboxyltransferase